MIGEITSSAPELAWLFIKLLIVIGLFLYSIFALVVVRQVTQMNKTLEVGFELPLKILSLIHFVAALTTLFVAIILL